MTENINTINMTVRAKGELRLVDALYNGNYIDYMRETTDEISGMIADAVDYFKTFKEVVEKLSEVVGDEALWEEFTEVKKYGEMFKNLEKLEDTKW